MLKRFFSGLSRNSKVIIVVILVLIAIRAILPEAIRLGLNWVLENKLENYYGHIADFDLSIYRGAYQIEGLVIRKKALPAQAPPLLDLKEGDISLSWRGVFHGRLLLDLILTEMKVVLLDNEDKDKRQFGNDEDTDNWKDVLDAMVPFKINNARLMDSSIFFQNFSKEPKVNLYVKDINIEVSDFSNMARADDLATHIQGSAVVMDDGKFNLDTRYNYRADNLNLKGKIELVQLNLVKLNPFFQHYMGIDVHRGTVKAYSEVNIQDNHIDAYLKPFIENINIVEIPENFASPKKAVVEILAAIGAWLTKNGKTEKAAFVIPIKGSTQEPKVKIWTTVKTGLINGFIKPLEEKFD